MYGIQWKKKLDEMRKSQNNHTFFFIHRFHPHPGAYMTLNATQTLPMRLMLTELLASCQIDERATDALISSHLSHTQVLDNLGSVSGSRIRSLGLVIAF